MARASIPEAAARLGVSVDTVRRRVRSGRLPATRDARGRYVVELPDGSPAPPPPAHAGDVDALLAEVRRQREVLEAQLAAQERHLEAHMAAEADLRRLLLELARRLGGG